MPNDSDTGNGYFRKRNVLLLLLGLVQFGGMGPKLFIAQITSQMRVASSDVSPYFIAALASTAAILLAGIQIDRHGPRRIALLCCYALMIVDVCTAFVVWIDGGFAGAWLFVVCANLLFLVIEMTGSVLILRLIPRERLPVFNILTVVSVEAVIFASIAFVVWNRIVPDIDSLGALLMLGLSLVATLGCVGLLSKLGGDGISDRGFPNEAVLEVFDRPARVAERDREVASSAGLRLWRNLPCRYLLLAAVVFSSALAMGAPYLVYPETYAFMLENLLILVYLALMTCGALLGAASFYLACVRRGFGFGVFMALCICLCGAALCFQMQVGDGLTAVAVIVVLQAGLTGFLITLSTLAQRLVPVALFGRAIAVFHVSVMLIVVAVEIAAYAIPALQTMDPYVFAAICGIALLISGAVLLSSPLARKGSAS